MADYVAAHITIGGTVRERIVPNLCEAIVKQGVSLEWGEWNFCPESSEELLNARQDLASAKVLRVFCDEVAYGNFTVLQEFLVDHQLPFDRWHESKYEIPCELMVYRPDGALRFHLTNLEGEIVVRAEPLTGLAELLQQTQTLLRTRGKQAASQVLRRCQQLVAEHLPLAIPPLTALTIVAD